VPFRSVAIKLIKALTDSASEVFQIDVLRPPTFARLDYVLRQAKAAGQPYHIVHFDGHGIHEDLNAKAQKKPPRRMRGYLVFENPDYQDKKRTGAWQGSRQIADRDRSILVGAERLPLSLCGKRRLNQAKPLRIARRAPMVL
jgi:hypothetical protein